MAGEPIGRAPAADPRSRAVRAEIRAVWVDGFNPGIRTPAEIDKLVADAQSANLNTLIVQVRRRADAFYVHTLEPPVEDPAYTPGFDALAYLIEKAHGAGLEVHAWMNAMPVWRKNTAPPTDPRHLFHTHGISAQGRDAWFTRAPEGDTVYPVGYFLDPGHPDAAAYIVEIARNLVKNYAIDGLHLDYIRYPETEKVTMETGAPVGYNPTSLERYRRARALAADATPSPGDPAFSDWRREQVSNLVRRIYIEANEINPRIKISAAVISWGDGPARKNDWRQAHAYWRVYQDWQSWMKEGIIDLAVPMNYFRQADARGRSFYSHWIEFERKNRHSRQIAAGLGAYLNSPEGNVVQARAALEPLRRGKKDTVSGISLFSYASTVKSMMQQLPVLFPSPAPVPAMAWKQAPDRGHLCGMVAGGDGVVVEIVRKRWTGWSRRPVRADANGFFAMANVEPGTYRVRIPGRKFESEPVEVQAGKVTRVAVP